MDEDVDLIISSRCLKLRLERSEVLFAHLEHEHRLPLISILGDSSEVRATHGVQGRGLSELRLLGNDNLIHVLGLLKNLHQFPSLIFLLDLKLSRSTSETDLNWLSNC